MPTTAIAAVVTLAAEVIAESEELKTASAAA